jgi:hypothetical protein
LHHRGGYLRAHRQRGGTSRRAGGAAELRGGGHRLRFAGLCYAELSSTLPVSGSAYTYGYTTLGEFVAWTMGVLLLLEYGIAAAVVAVAGAAMSSACWRTSASSFPRS